MSSKSERTHKRIIECAMALIFSSSYDEVTVQQICGVSGISRPTFYLHFKSKEQIMAEYYESVNTIDESLGDWVRTAADSWTRILRILAAYLDRLCNEDHRVVTARYLSYRLTTAAEDQEGSDALTNLSKNLFEILTPLIRQAQQDGIVANTSDPYHLCRSVFMLLMGDIYTWCAGDSADDVTAGFFWSLESVFGVNDAYRGLWKLPENAVPVY